MSASPVRENDADATVTHDSASADALPDQSDVGTNQANITHDMGSFYEIEVKEQDRWLPIANVARIMKTALPDNAKIAKEAKECMQECVSEFISFITSEAAEKCQQEKRKTVNGEDILFAMTSLGFENYGEALKIYLARFRDSTATRNTEHQAQVASRASVSAASGATTSKTAATIANNAGNGAATQNHGRAMDVLGQDGGTTYGGEHSGVSVGGVYEGDGGYGGYGVTGVEY